LSSQLYFLILRPKRYFGTLLYLLTRPHPKTKGRFLNRRFMTFLHFIEGVYAAFLLRNRDFRELHAHFADRAATIALVVGRILNKPYSLSIHAGPDIFVDPVLLPEKVLEARHVVTCTLYNKTHVEAVVGQDLGHKISHVNHGLDLKQYGSRRPPSGERPVILSVGQLVERKGFAQLIRACRRLRDQGYDFACHIVGQGDQREELENLIQTLSLEHRVTLRGALPHEKVIEEYDQATIFVLACTTSRVGNMDGIPNVLPEAMAMQLPVISTNLSAIPELINDQLNGLLVPPGDIVSLAAAMARLLDEPALRERLGRKGRQLVVDRFDIERNIRCFASTLWPDWYQARFEQDFGPKKSCTAMAEN
jgi:glycosyltransferase involved in cell wall biosynthesis